MDAAEPYTCLLKFARRNTEKTYGLVTKNEFYVLQSEPEGRIVGSVTAFSSRNT